MPRTFHAFLLALVTILPAAAQSRMEGAVKRNGSAAREAADPRAIRALSRPSRRVTLRSLSVDEAKPVRRKSGLTSVGVNRALPADLLSQGEWSTTAEGKRVWRVAITSTGAESVRLHFSNFNAAGGRVWLLPAEGDAGGPYVGKGPFGDGEFWSDTVDGEQVTVAYEPADSTATDVPFTIGELAHRFAVAKAASVTRSTAASCALDLACFPDYSAPASAVAMMIFQSDGGTYQCSGALVNSAASPAVPLFLTANHCISTAEEAKSLITIFNYQTPTCNGVAPVMSTLPRVNGASLLATQPMALGDFTLLQLTAFPNTDVKVLGWSAKEIGSAEKVTSMSHPVGDFKHIALGTRTRDVTIRFSDGDEMPAAKGLQVSWTQGVTQGGSSGSPLLATLDGSPYVVGTLSAGPDVDEDNDRQVCALRNLNASYGRFAAAFPYLESYLTAATLSGPATNSLTAAIVAGKTARLFWQTAGVSQVQIRVLSPSGPAMTGIESATGSALTGDWVAEGMTFYLQDATSGDSAGAAKTLAQVSVSFR